ncbi:MAG: hypothetical protein M1819_003587 [Sarea resinae]|nr:MAG: hypothetical protein M1819_003587 [Sarea resinae]
MASQTPIRIVIFTKRAEGMSKEEFDNYWRDVHGANFIKMPAAQKYLLKYEQYHEPPALRHETETLFGFKPTGYDGVGVISFASLDDAKALFTDKDFLAWTIPDEAKVFEPKTQLRFVQIGDSEVLFDRSVGNLGK